MIKYYKQYINIKLIILYEDRDANIQLITKDIRSLSDDTITNICDKMWELCEEEGDKKKSRVQKIKFIIEGIDLISDDDLLKIKEDIDDINKRKKIGI